MRCRFYVIVIAVLVAGCGKPDAPTADGKPSTKADAPAEQPRPKKEVLATDASTSGPPITSMAKLKGLHNGTMVMLMPEKIDVEILVDEGGELVIALGILKATLIQDLWFVANTGEGAKETEVFRGEKRAQFGISESWVFQSGRLVELLKQGRDGKVTLHATAPSGAQSTPEFLAIEITWPVKKSGKGK